ncbi:MAG: 50S ribosomal protein L22 [Deltaproteobacteria bacterium CG_4_8_14_3_um_filter_51_11]|nr:50S ribosomal protein L22 [bacterium]OIP39418.1 MAG: 50S ribosomal protein L22 [Desulfobacteraceae bacterium CG2_30_51_40]PIP45297.1 MAG: 50S ribosomal protein L22 [Deltaproteobacteria bacterium CG23_combo_of_CG06-09_8_20_14_all_51_20]PIW02152.1 MAG: 50S ribosomal protein L22 [Deltaproteobacteria bacterium CG17_big_fil_post_rev_8_21_14_2_50_51_6]PIX21047.1 MAG: 50S ribosomal protein L22 [Deltaproteobacteria bacterium CG_4_8_14_3_um_filter_51_11]PIY22930.1 MAG: 50S ribosomal protein L22 [Del
METKAIARYMKISPRKIRLVMDEVRGKRVEYALNMLSFSPSKGSGLLKKLINSAVANAVQNNGADVDALLVKRVFADEGPVMKRWQPRALGRATRIRKRTSHLTVVVGD